MDEQLSDGQAKMEEKQRINQEFDLQFSFLFICSLHESSPVLSKWVVGLTLIPACCYLVDGIELPHCGMNDSLRIMHVCALLLTVTFRKENQKASGFVHLQSKVGALPIVLVCSIPFGGV